MYSVCADIRSGGRASSSRPGTIRDLLYLLALSMELTWSRYDDATTTFNPFGRTLDRLAIVSSSSSLLLSSSYGRARAAKLRCFCVRSAPSRIRGCEPRIAADAEFSELYRAQYCYEVSRRRSRPRHSDDEGGSGVCIMTRVRSESIIVANR